MAPSWISPTGRPTGWCFVDELPTTATGKVQKGVLRQLIATGELVPQTVRTSPSSPRS